MSGSWQAISRLAFVVPESMIGRVILSESKSFLFVHVQKTAGSSIRLALLPHALQVPPSRWGKLLSRLRLHRDWRRHAFRHHAPLRDAEAVLPPDVFERMFKFSFVRNPWDRLVSFYSFMLQRPQHHRHALVKRLGSFEAYVDYEIQRDKISQWERLRTRSDELGVDFVGRFERLPEDFAHACRRLGVEGELPAHNLTDHEDFRTYYTPELAERVGEHWRRDVEEFGYSFDDAPGERPPPDAEDAETRRVRSGRF